MPNQSPSDSDELKPFQCDSCGLKDLTLDEVERHIRENHPEDWQMMVDTVDGIIDKALKETRPTTPTEKSEK